MGCGQSKIGNIYPKNKKNKNNSNKKNGDSIHRSIVHGNGNSFDKMVKWKLIVLLCCWSVNQTFIELYVVVNRDREEEQKKEYVKNCDKVEGHLASFFLMLPASKKKEASPLNIKRRGRRTSSRLENKQKGAKMWLKVLRQNISHLARRAKGNNYIKQFWTWEKRKRK
ncbi:mediator of RNA polymerase II transcription subunit 15-like isoform X1 [Vespula maculifrons]|uniref:Mediator of RNA polymerase II transcription subunit 15-like isoform X1 n=1 Tax=Vespula maculifrons TaxID=7453 RepID=A0ABD2BX27_VESMC